MQIGCIGNIIAVGPAGEHTIPLLRACERCVDWYRRDDQAA
jgi:hypothetical protein